MRCYRNFGILLIIALVASLTTSIAWGDEYLEENGDPSSPDLSKTMDSALGGMVKWLDQPVTSQLSPPPSQYTFRSSEANDLKVMGTTGWTQYAVAPVGTLLEVVANISAGGIGQFYKLFQTNNVSIERKTYQFNPGKNEMVFKAEKVGRYMLYFVVNNQPSNVVIVDVSNQASI